MGGWSACNLIRRLKIQAGDGPVYKMAPAVEVVNAFTEVPCGTCKVSEKTVQPVACVFWAGHIARQAGVSTPLEA